MCSGNLSAVCIGVKIPKPDGFNVLDFQFSNYLPVRIFGGMPPFFPLVQAGMRPRHKSIEGGQANPLDAIHHDSAWN